MANIHILVAVNVAAAIPDGVELGDYVYMVDDSLDGSSGEGTDELWTGCESGDTLVWTVCSIDPDLKVSISGFDGDAVAGDNPLISPAEVPQTGSTTWSSPVYGTGTKVQYSIYLNLNGKTNKSFDPYITATRPQAAK